MKKATLFILCVSVAVWSACGGSSSGKNTSGLSHRVFVSNTYSGVLEVADAKKDVVSSEVAVGNSPTFMMTSPDGKTTLVYNSGSNSLSAVANFEETNSSGDKINGETLVQTVSFQNFTDSIALASDSKTGYAAIRNLTNASIPHGAIQAFNYFDNSIFTLIPVTNVRWLAVDHASKHLLAMSDTVSSTTGAWDPSWVDITTVDFSQQVQDVATPITGLNLDHPVAAFFSSDDTKAYIVSCGSECGGTQASVTEINTSTKAVIAQVTVPAARVAVVEGSTLWVGGTQGDGTNAITPVDLSTTVAAGTPITSNVANGTVTVMRFLANKLWVGSKNCSTSSCLTVVNPSTNTASLGVPNSGAGNVLNTGAANLGDVTGMTYIDFRNLLYVVEGGRVHLYDTNANQQIMLNNFTVTGKVYDAVFVD